MQKRDFWIFNIRYMNDSQEFENGKAICKEVIEKKFGIYDEDEVSTFDAITFMNEDQYDEIRLFPQRIIYEDDMKRKIFESILDIEINFINRFSDTVDMCIEGISDALFYYFALMKDAHFEHEHEFKFLNYFNK